MTYMTYWNNWLYFRTTSLSERQAGDERSLSSTNTEEVTSSHILWYL